MRTSSSSPARKRKVVSPILDPVQTLPPSFHDSSALSPFVLDAVLRYLRPSFPRRSEDNRGGGNETTTVSWDFYDEDEDEEGEGDEGGGKWRKNGGCDWREGAVQGRGEGSKKCLATMVVLLGLLCGQWCGGGAEALAGSQKYSTRTVRTRYGTLRGVEDRSSTSVETYYGVPYATPPIGALRYMPPVTPTPWRGTKLADTMPPACPQNPPKPDSSLPRSKRAYLERLAPMLANQSEDCLYLNLYVPKTPHGESHSVLSLVASSSFLSSSNESGRERKNRIYYAMKRNLVDSCNGRYIRFGRVKFSWDVTVEAAITYKRVGYPRRIAILRDEIWSKIREFRPVIARSNLNVEQSRPQRE